MVACNKNNQSHSLELLFAVHCHSRVNKTMRNTTQSAFTIVELLVVIVVIGILSAITIVSYGNISSNARKSALANNLVQANKALNVYKEINSGSGVYPSSLSDARLTLDNNATYSYYVSADGSNYCLQGTTDNMTQSIAGNNPTVSDATCVAATNLVSNGDFSQGANGWSAMYSSISMYNGLLSMNAAAQWGKARTIIPTPVVGDKYYYRAEVNTPTASVYYFGIYNLEQYIVTVGVQNVSSIRLITTSAQAYFDFGDSRSTGWEVAYIDNVLCIDLTAAFGAGNEPTATQMDAMLANFPNSWFNGTNIIQKPTS